MKAQHQIKFKRRRKSGKLKVKGSEVTAAKFLDQLSNAEDVVKATVVVGARELGLARALSDTEKEVRDSSLSSLREWLSQHSKQIGENEFDKLWKGLFYCIWMADKRPVITETINNVVDLADIAGWPFLNALYICLMREWFGIDRHRVDKFYELANVGTEKCVSLVMAGKNPVMATQAYMTLLQTRVWRAAKLRGLGLALHLLDVYMDKVMSPIMVHGISLPREDKKELFEVLIRSPLSMIGSANGHLLAVGKRIQERILERLLGFIACEDVHIESTSQLQIAKGVSEQVFKVAADKDTPDEVRQALYNIHIDLQAFANSAGEE